MNINATIIGQTIAFAFFVWFCMKYVWPPIIGALNERQKKIADGLAAADRASKDLELAQVKAVEELHLAREQAKEILEQANQRATVIVEEAKDEARKEGERLIVAARAEIEQEANQARESTPCPGGQYCRCRCRQDSWQADRRGSQQRTGRPVGS